MLIDHVNLSCQDMPGMVQFLESLGCVKTGHRPPFNEHGFWLYDDSDRAVIHLSPAASANGHNTVGLVDHIAFRAEKSVGVVEADLNAAGLEFTGSANSAAQVYQFKIKGPERLIVELILPLNL